jgi:hypothetical protein
MNKGDSNGDSKVDNTGSSFKIDRGLNHVCLLLLVLLSLNISCNLEAATGSPDSRAVEWGNGEFGFSGQLAPFELPFEQPLVVTLQQCQLYFNDSIELSFRERIKQTRDEICVYGEVDRGQGLGSNPKKVIDWSCFDRNRSDSLIGMVNLAIDNYRLGLRCVSSDKSIKSVSEFMQEFPAPTPNSIAGSDQSRFLTQEWVPVQIAIKGERFLRKLVKGEGLAWGGWLNQDLLGSENGLYELEFRDCTAAFEAGGRSGKVQNGNIQRMMCGGARGSLYREFLSGYHIFDYAYPVLKLQDGFYLKATRSEVKFEVPPLRSFSIQILGEGLPISLNNSESYSLNFSNQDLDILAQLTKRIQALSLFSISSFVSSAELLHYRNRNLAIVKQVDSWAQLLLGKIQEATHLSSEFDRDSRYFIYVQIQSDLRNIVDSLTKFYDVPVYYGGNCENRYSYSENLFQRVFSQSYVDCRSMDQSITKINHLLERLKFSFPDKIATYDAEGCRYIVQITETLQGLHNQILIFDDFPLEFYESEYAKKIVSTLQALNNLNYKKNNPGNFLESVLPHWRNVCKAERPRVESILSGFRKQK